MKICQTAHPVKNNVILTLFFSMFHFDPLMLIHFDPLMLIHFGPLMLPFDYLNFDPLLMLLGVSKGNIGKNRVNVFFQKLVAWMCSVKKLFMKIPHTHRKATVMALFLVKETTSENLL